ncbi:MAG: bis(5'-nucleosyl)-tetraphosphatase (symmetrical) YqeK [Lachnospiraceae bacterium]|nr:bis(5'-nucleosyl)-tetraphosphatase (symmetrical) YqeK [Lachnospiraceae bacterium]
MFSDPDLHRIEKKVKKYVDKDRFEHVRGVTYMCAALAMHYGLDMKQAMIAGLLHDCAKNLSDKEKLEICEKKKIPVTSIEEESPQLLHGKLGAYFAREKYGIDDEEILHAIEVHTTGCVDMSELDMVVYISDFIEPNRKKIPCLDEARELSFISLEGATEFILKHSIDYVAVKNQPLDPHTVDAYKYLLEKNH